MPRRGCFYTRCKNAELEAFYKARTGRDLPASKNKRGWTKQELADLLRKVDRRPWCHGVKFRFLDLPPEMRNTIYRELLPARAPEVYRERNEPKCKTAILRVCKQIHSESHGILYGDHEGEIAIAQSINIRPTQRDVRRSVLLFSTLPMIVYRTDYSKLADNCGEWPFYLLKFQKVNVKIEMSVTGLPVSEYPYEVQAATNQELYGLVSFLSKSTALKTIRLKLGNAAAQVEHSVLLKVLQPLVRLGPIVTVDLFNVPDVVKEHIVREKEGTQGNMPNVLADFFETRQKMKHLDDLRRLVDFKDVTHGRITANLKRMDEDIDIRTLIDAEAEEKLAQSTKDTQKFLASNLVKDLNRLARQQIKDIKKDAAKKVDQVQALQENMNRYETEAKGVLAAATASD